MMLKVLRGSRMLALRERVKGDPDALDAYATESSFPDITDADLLNTTISVPDAAPILAVSSSTAPASDDAHNAILVYNYLGVLSRTQAADSRLWVNLAHTTFWEYTRARWGEDDKGKLRTAVLRHWFVPEGGGKSALRTQAISRLWWAAHLTYAPWEKDPALSAFQTADKFRFTRILLRQQQIYFDLIERDFGSDLRLRTCVLDAFDRHLASVKWKDGLSREASKRFNLLVKHRQIASLDIDSLRKTCDDLVASVAAALSNGARAGASASAPATSAGSHTP